MNFRNCVVKHNPPHTYGDCIRACVATLIDRDDVPHTFDSRPVEEAWGDLRAYLQSINLNLFIGAFSDDPREFMSENNDSVYYILLCSNSDTNHAVVCRGKEVVHNPSWYKTAISGPTEIGVYFVVVIVKQP